MSPVKLKHLHLKSGTYWYVRRAGGKVVWRQGRREALQKGRRPAGKPLARKAEGAALPANGGAG